MLFYRIAFMFFQALFYFCVGSFIIFIIGILCGLIKPTNQKIVYEACIVLIILSPVCRFMANEIMHKINLLKLKGGG